MSVSGSGCPGCWWHGAVYIGDTFCPSPCPRCGGFSAFARAKDGIDDFGDATGIEREVREALRAWHITRNPSPSPMLRTVSP